jgi:hypothetical protein
MDITSLPKGVGSGFVWDKQGHIVTNFHVINKVDNAIVTLTDPKKKTSKQYKAKLTGVDPDKDIAVLKIDAPQDELTPLPVGNSTTLRIGQNALAIGMPKPHARARLCITLTVLPKWKIEPMCPQEAVLGTCEQQARMCLEVQDAQQV